MKSKGYFILIGICTLLVVCSTNVFSNYKVGKGEDMFPPNQITSALNISTVSEDDRIPADKSVSRRLNDQNHISFSTIHKQAKLRFNYVVLKCALLFQSFIVLESDTYVLFQKILYITGRHRLLQIHILRI